MPDSSNNQSAKFAAVKENTNVNEDQKAAWLKKIRRKEELGLVINLRAMKKTQNNKRIKQLIELICSMRSGVQLNRKSHPNAVLSLLSQLTGTSPSVYRRAWSVIQEGTLPSESEEHSPNNGNSQDATMTMTLVPTIKLKKKNQVNKLKRLKKKLAENGKLSNKRKSLIKKEKKKPSEKKRKTTPGSEEKKKKPPRREKKKKTKPKKRPPARYRKMRKYFHGRVKSSKSVTF